jgi:hypothetical protein
MLLISGLDPRFPGVKRGTESRIRNNSCVLYSTGTPWQPEFGGWAFNLPRGQHCLDKWERIPEDTDILVSLL